MAYDLPIVYSLWPIAYLVNRLLALGIFIEQIRCKT